MQQITGSRWSFTTWKILNPLELGWIYSHLCSPKNETMKPGWQHTIYDIGAKCFKSNVETNCSEKKDHFQNITADWQSIQKSLMEKYKEIHVIFMAANTTSIQKHMDHGVIMMFNS